MHLPGTKIRNILGFNQRYNFVKGDSWRYHFGVVVFIIFGTLLLFPAVGIPIVNATQSEITPLLRIISEGSTLASSSQLGMSNQTTTTTATRTVPPLQQQQQLQSPSVLETRQHRSNEADIGQDKCGVQVRGGFFSNLARILTRVGTGGYWQWDPVNKVIDVSYLYPQWVPVEGSRPVTLEGTVVAHGNEFPHVSHEDMPTNHDTHDMTFHVKPDDTPDKRYTNLLSLRPDGQQAQSTIEVEWETGLAQNDQGPFLGPNIRGDSGGYFSAGHKRYDTIWNWPTVGDRVHVEGFWIWDRGHSGGKTEIHPPRLVAIQRDLPSPVITGPDIPPFFATQVDIFASGDGGTMWNNRGIPQYSSFVQKVPMSERDYSFVVSNTLPRPSDNSMLRWMVIKRPGDTFAADPIIEKLPSNPASVKVTIPWKSRGLPDNQVFGRTIFLYWDEGRGIPQNYNLNIFRVTLDKLSVIDNEEPTDGEFRVFIEVGGKWFFLNEAAAVTNPFTRQPGPFGDILNDGIGDTGDEWWVRYDPRSPAAHILNKVPTFLVYLPPGKSFRIHSSGWEADGVNDVFGNLIHPGSSCDFQKSWLPSNLFSEGVWFSGCQDDPIGEVNRMINLPMATAMKVLGKPFTFSSAGSIKDDPGCGQVNPNDDYRIDVRVEALR